MLEPKKVLPSQPQNARRSRVQRRDFAAHTPGVSAPQPLPSHTPESHSAPARQLAPAGSGAGFAGDDGAPAPAPAPHAPRLWYRVPGQLPDAENVMPSQPQYWRMS